MNCIRPRKMSSYVMSIIVLLASKISFAQARFTKVPSAVLYVSAGNSAIFAWDYAVDNSTGKLQDCSPQWYFYEQNDKFLIGCEIAVGPSQRIWHINNSTCPKRLLNPIRVRMEQNATLVIENVSLADSGVYGCQLTRTKQNQITSKVQLVVTTQPKMSIPMKSNANINITEGEDFILNCSATGYPKPNVTWINSTDSTIMNAGVGGAALRIKNISRYHSGWYECRAGNNRNEEPEIVKIDLIVYFKPRIYNANWVESGENIILRCLTSGYPPPLVTWYHNNGVQISIPGIEKIRGGSLLAFKAKDIDHYAQYKCKAENAVGRDEFFINITHFESMDEHVDLTNSTRLTSRPATPIATTNRAQVSKPSKRGNNSITRAVIGVILTGLLMAIMIPIAVVLIKRKKCTQKKDDNVATNGMNTGISSLMTDVDQEIPTYAEIEVSKNISKCLDDVPIYATIDKSKKRRPGQIIYTELEILKLKEERSSVILPPPYRVSEYAEIKGLSKSEYVEPIYETI